MKRLIAIVALVLLSFTALGQQTRASLPQLGRLSQKGAVRAATTTTLAGYTSTATVLTAGVNAAFPAVDGVTLSAFDRLLVKDETGTCVSSAGTCHNGIYALTQVGDGSHPWILTRTGDANDAVTLLAATSVWVSEGTANANTYWELTTSGTVTVGTTAVTFARTVFKRLQSPTSGAQDNANKTFVWEALAAGSETLYINGVAIDSADYTLTASTGSITLGGTITAPGSADQLRLTYLLAASSVGTFPTHALLSSTHTDTSASSPVRGGLIVANSTPAWAQKALCSSGNVLASDGTDLSCYTSFFLNANGNVVIGTGALATNATDGFFYMDSMAGAPSGTPTLFTGRVPIAVDTVNNKLMGYYTGAWNNLSPAAGGGTGSPTSSAVEFQPFLETSSSSYMTVPDNTALDATSAVSISAWIYIKGQPATSGGVFSKATAAGGTGAATCGDYTILFTATEWDFGVNGSGACSWGAIATFAHGIAASMWHHIVGTYTTTGTANVKLYIDGVQRATSGTYTTNLTHTGTIGVVAAYFDKSVAGRSCDCIIDDIRIWKDVALTATDVTNLYNKGIGQQQLDAMSANETVAWRFDEGSGTTATDSVSGLVLTSGGASAIEWVRGIIPR